MLLATLILVLCAVTEEPDIAVSSITIIAGKQLNHVDQATPHSNGWYQTRTGGQTFRFAWTIALLDSRANTIYV